MDDHNKLAFQNLIPLLKRKSAVLMVGAGSSMFVGYKDWKGLAMEMARVLVPPLINHEGKCVSKTGEELHSSTIANTVKKILKEENREQDYFNLLEKECGPRNNGQMNYEEMHVSLVKLGFRAITTTNYDIVLEYALSAANRERANFYPNPVDLCGHNKHLVGRFLRELNDDKEPDCVLHIHGLYSNPKGIILTDEDYKNWYAPDTKLDDEGNPIGTTLDSSHRQVLFSLLSQHRLFFVGFSLTDKFFVHVIRIIQDQFQLGSDPVHFATMSFTEPLELEEKRKDLSKIGVTPLFYYVPPRKENQPEDHSALRQLIFELDQAIAGDRREDSFRGVSKDWRNISTEMLER